MSGMAKVNAPPAPRVRALESAADVKREAGRLYRALVDTKLSSTVEGENWGLRDPGVAMFFAQVATEDSLGKARDALLATLENVKTQPITEAEVRAYPSADVARLALRRGFCLGVLSR